MTKKGFKQVMLSIDTYKELASLAKEQKSSINGVLQRVLPLFRNQQIEGSNPSGGFLKS
jgi:hypothetical protein